MIASYKPESKKIIEEDFTNILNQNEENQLPYGIKVAVFRLNKIVFFRILDDSFPLKKLYIHFWG